jgi:hypothetical protein
VAEAVQILGAIGIIALQIYVISVLTALRRDVISVRRDLIDRTSSPTGTAPAAPSPLRTWGKDVGRLREAEELRQGGILSDQEFALVKAEILAGWSHLQPPTDPEDVSAPVQPRFSVAIRDMSGVDPSEVAEIVRRYANFDSDHLQAFPVTLHVGVSLETGRLLIEDLAEAGVSAEVVTSR